jgi:Ca2+-binding RTX toxin-like protein
MRPTPIVLLALTASLLGAGGTAASTVSIDGDTLRYDAAPGEFNELNISLQSGEFIVQEGFGSLSVPVIAQPPCEASPKTLIGALCPPTGVNRIAVSVGDENDYVGIGGDYVTTIDLGDGADRVFGGPQADDVRGGPGNDTIRGNGGRDVLSGDRGDDMIEAADALPDQIACGPGIDDVNADFVDAVADDCELVNIGPGQPQQITLRDPAPTPLSTLQTRGLRAHLICPAACVARAQLLLPAVAGASATLAGASRATRLVATGRARRNAAGGLTVVTSLRRGGAQRLRRLRPAHLTLRTTVTVRSSTTILQRFVHVRS